MILADFLTKTGGFRREYVGEIHEAPLYKTIPIYIMWLMSLVLGTDNTNNNYYT
jgi:hypothetical protein